MGISLDTDTLFLLPLLALGVPVILIVGVFAVTRSDTVERPNRIAQWYGYTVCLIAVVTLLFSSVSVVNSLFTLASPLQAANDYGPSLHSFDAYRATYQETPYGPRPEGDAELREPPSEPELRQRYEALRASRTDRNLYDAQRSLVTSGLLVLFSIGLFVLHWRWLRRLGAG